MKRTLLFSVLIFFFSACSDFQRMHYRKLKKVPASGFIEARAALENNSIHETVAASESDSSGFAEPEIAAADIPATPGKKNSYRLVPDVKKQIEKTQPVKKMFREKLQKKKNAVYKHGKFKSVMLIILALVLGIMLMMLGGVTFVAGFYALSIFPILAGLVVFCIGLLPFIGLIGFAGKKYKKSNIPYEER
ncbi:MAG: hypothetical protein M3R17_10390 [Bacteroidota bacterium]|nr:hypothetical protein [Bacteroidota bacterium]